MNILYLDLETYSDIPINKGSYRYAERVEITVFAYALNDGPIQVWDCTEGRELYIEPHYSLPVPPIDLQEMLLIEDLVICAHNGIGFDRLCLPEDFQHFPWVDTRLHAYAHGLPGGLDILSNTVYRMPSDMAKMKEGKSLVRFFCMPQKATKKKPAYRATRLTHPEKWQTFLSYAGNDISSMREIFRRMPTWNDTEQERAVLDLTTKINDRGVLVDVDLCQHAIEALAKDKIERDTTLKERTDINSALQTAKMLNLINSMIEPLLGFKIPNLKKPTLDTLLDEHLPEDIRYIITERLTSSKVSTAKYKKFLEMICQRDNRIKGMLTYRGAFRTGRFSSKGVQLHNLARPSFKQDDIENGISFLQNDCLNMWYDVTNMCSSILRSVLVAPTGKKLVVSDLSAIESRTLAWLAGEQGKLDIYRQIDSGLSEYDIYQLIYASTFSVDPADIFKNGKGKAERQLGKVIELSMGYGGGVGAGKNFADIYKVDLDEVGKRIDFTDIELYEGAKRWYEKSLEKKKTYGLSKSGFIGWDYIKRLWRKANANTVQFWYDLENGVRDVLNGRCRRRTLDKIEIDKKGSWLRLRLPSGRFLSYPAAKLIDEKITFLGVNPYAGVHNKWQRLNTYGGKLAENVSQAAACDILIHGMIEAENAGYKILMTVHDEDITEAPDTPEYNEKHLSTIISTPPAWAPDIPLSAGGFEGYRYRKD